MIYITTPMTIRLGVCQVTFSIPKLQRSIGEMLNWFESNYMEANLNKFQFIIFHKKKTNVPVAITKNTSVEPIRFV